jgi:hypothetical protein
VSASDGTTWLLHQGPAERFPYLLTIVRDGRPLLSLRVRERWPGPGMQIFCLRDDGNDPPQGEPVERVPVRSLARIGRKLSVVLDRPTRKRCDFLFLTKPYRDGTGSYEQIFWRTEQAMRAHRSRSRPQLHHPAETLEIAVDPAERYAWTFPGSRVVRRKVSAGDYGLVVGDRVVAAVERKSFENMLAEIAALQILHQKLVELTSHPNTALVIEAQYADFLDPSRLARCGKWTPAYLARVFAEIAAVHPRLPVVFAGNRKLANGWTAGFFVAVAARLADHAPPLIAEAVAAYGRGEDGSGLDDRVRLTVLHELPESFALDDVRRQFPGQDPVRLRRVLGTLRLEGRVVCEGRGRAARWRRVTPAAP